MHVTDRTIRSDIQIINEILEKNGSKIKLKRKTGYYIEINDQEKYNAFLYSIKQNKMNNLELDTSQDRIKYLLNILLYSNNYISLDDLADKIYVSKNTLQNYIKTLKNIFLKYNLEYISKTNVGIKVIGNENDKRKCLVENVLSFNFQNYVTGFTKDEYTLFEGIDLDLLKQIIANKLTVAQIKTNDFNFKNLIIHFALMISRIQFDCYINTNNAIKIDDNYANFINDIAKEIEKAFDITISEGEKKYIYSHLVANTRLNDLVSNDNKIKALVEELLNNIYARLDTSYKNKDEEDECQLVAAYFVCDYYTFVDKKKNEIGGVDYMYPEMVENFSQYAQTSFYSYKNQYPELEVLKYNIISYSPSKVTIAGLEDNDYYNILISLTFNEEIEGLNSTVNVTVVRVEDRYYVCGLDNA